MNIRKEILDELLQECKTPPDLFGERGILKQLRPLWWKERWNENYPRIWATASMNPDQKDKRTVATVIVRKLFKETLA